MRGDGALLQGRTCKLEESWQYFGLYDRRIGVRFPGKANDFPLLQSIQNGYMAHPSSKSKCTMGYIGRNVRSTKAENAHYTPPPPHVFMVPYLIKHRDFNSDCDELHALSFRTSGRPGNYYTKQNNQRCKCVRAAKAGGRPWTLLSVRNTGMFFVKTLPFRIHCERRSGISADCIWMGHCAARSMRWSFSWRNGDAHTMNRFKLGAD